MQSAIAWVFFRNFGLKKPYVFNIPQIPVARIARLFCLFLYYSKKNNTNNGRYPGLAIPVTI